MLVLLPPSEGKAPGGDGPPVDVATLSYPSLNPVRRRLLRSAGTAVRRGPTRPAVERYTGVLYQQLGYSTLPAAARRRADRSLLVASRLFGLLTLQDAIPDYRLPPGGLATTWRPALEPVLASLPGLVVDLRSGSYVSLGRLPGAVTVRVLRETDGRRTVVSHDNKFTKGRLARALCLSGARTLDQVAQAGRDLVDDVDVSGSRIDLVLYGLASAHG